MRNKRRILIIEDNPDIAERLTIRLELAGYDPPGADARRKRAAAHGGRNPQNLGIVT